ncbi:MAG TPA: PF20097 family protein [Gammaproteobacteria bacterium]|nr:PF20097 family protein [Gammaproteobacteria bacterium]
MTLALAIVAAVLLIGMPVLLWLIVRRVTKSAQVVEARDGELDWPDRRCPICGGTMAQGFVMAGRGLIWAGRHRKAPGTFAHIGQSLANTISMNLPPALNMAWRCEPCSLVLVDHSRMIKLKRR